MSNASSRILWSNISEMCITMSDYKLLNMMMLNDCNVQHSTVLLLVFITLICVFITLIFGCSLLLSICLCNTYIRSFIALIYVSSLHLYWVIYYTHIQCVTYVFSFTLMLGYLLRLSMCFM